VVDKKDRSRLMFLWGRGTERKWKKGGNGEGGEQRKGIVEGGRHYAGRKFRGRTKRKNTIRTISVLFKTY